MGLTRLTEISIWVMGVGTCRRDGVLGWAGEDGAQRPCFPHPPNPVLESGALHLITVPPGSKGLVGYGKSGCLPVISALEQSRQEDGEVEASPLYIVSLSLS